MVKSVNHLYEYYFDKYLIKLAFRLAFRGKKKKHPIVQEILDNLPFHINNFYNMMDYDMFKPQVHKVRIKRDSISGKPRFISQLYYYLNAQGEVCYEHVLHWVTILILRKFLFKGLYTWSCSAIPGRGAIYGKRHLERYIREHAHTGEIKYCLKSDIYHFFQEVDIDKIKTKFKRKIHDERFLNVLFKIIDSNIGYYKNQKMNLGLPLGFYSSQWFANWFLQDFDHFVKERLHLKCYIRYADDKVILFKNKKELRQKLEKIKEFLAKEHLSLKSNYQIYRFSYKGKFRDIDYMGYRFWRGYTTLRKTILCSIRKKANKIHNKKLKGYKITYYEAAQFLSYLGYIKHAKIHKWYMKYIQPKINITELKSIISTHSKKEVRKVKEAQYV